MAKLLDQAEGTGVELFMTEIHVADWSEAVAWYRDAFGVSVTVLDLDHKFALLQAGGSRLAIRQRESVESSPSGLRLHFLVKDLADAHTRLLRLGIEVTTPADHPREPYREVRLHDPAGTAITLFAWREGS